MRERFEVVEWKEKHGGSKCLMCTMKASLGLIGVLDVLGVLGGRCEGRIAVSASSGSGNRQGTWEGQGKTEQARRQEREVCWKRKDVSERVREATTVDYFCAVLCCSDRD